MSGLLVLDTPAENESQVQDDKEYDVVDEELSFDSAYPEGGRDAVMSVIGAFLSGVIHHGMVNLTGAFQAQ